LICYEKDKKDVAKKLTAGFVAKEQRFWSAAPTLATIASFGDPKLQQHASSADISVGAQFVDIARKLSVIQKKRSPLKGKPLRNPGQSLDEQIHDVVSNYALGPAVFALFLFFLAIFEWLKYLQSIAPKPVLYSIPAVAAIAYAAFRFVRVRRHLRALRLGRDGEKEVGHGLESLRKKGYEVFHDIVGNGFNIDHVLIGPAGIFCIETKTHSKPRNGRPSVVFDGEKVIIGGRFADSNPVLQSRAQARWLRDLSFERTGRRFAVRPVIVYPGWFVKNRSPRRADMWVLNPKGLPAFLDHETVELNPEDICMVSSGLNRYIATESLETR
jgi:Nuclease-related domain